MEDKLKEGVIFEDEDKVSEEDIRDAKEEIIKSALNGDEGVDLDGADDDTLDVLLTKLARVDEKVECILENKKDLDDEALVECISKHIGMHLDEAKDVLAFYRNK